MAIESTSTPDADQGLALADGNTIPLVGFGTWPLRGDTAYRLVRHALDVGYRHLDTATYYGNEAEVGRALCDSGVDREAVFVTTKLPPGNAGRELATIEASLRELDLDYVDLWLVHWPPGGSAAPKTWAEFIAARDRGLARSIGVSNYDLSQIDEITSASGEAPVLDQVQYGPALHDPELLGALAERRVAPAGWSPFKSTNLAHPTLVTVAETHGVTPAQVIVRWHVEHGIVCLPRSSNEDRVASNVDVFRFELTTDELADIDALA